MLFERMGQKLLTTAERERHRRRLQVAHSRASLARNTGRIRDSGKREIADFASQPTSLIAAAALGFALTTITPRGRKGPLPKALSLISIGTKLL